MIDCSKYDDVRKDYINGKSVLDLSHLYNNHTGDIQNILNKGNIEKISQAKRNNPNLIENYFEEIDSSAKAYWLGWILTDGGVSHKSGLEIAIQSSDEYILHLLERDLGIENHVKGFGNAYCRFSFASVRLLKDLEKYGVVPNKTLSLKYPTNVPIEYETDLLRGMFEGDGGLTYGVATRFYKHRNKHYTKPYRELSFTGTYDMCKSFHDILAKYSHFTPKNINRNHSMFRVRWSSSKEIISIFHALYDNCGEYCLKRKYDIFKKIEKESVNQ